MPIYKKVNKLFFRKWSQNMAYVLGFIAADGTITLTRRGTHFWSINISDKDLIYKIRSLIESNHAVSKRQKFSSKHKQLYRIQIGSKEMCIDLINLGFKYKKASCMVVPNISYEYYSSFVRGYFDGDGNVWMGYLNKHRNKPTLVLQSAFTSCSWKFLLGIRDILLNAGLGRGTLYSLKDSNAHRLQYSTKDSLKLSHYMYNSTNDENNLYLKRKKMVFDRFEKKMQR